MNERISNPKKTSQVKIWHLTQTRLTHDPLIMQNYYVYSIY